MTKLQDHFMSIYKECGSVLKIQSERTSGTDNIFLVALALKCEPRKITDINKNNLDNLLL